MGQSDVKGGKVATGIAAATAMAVSFSLVPLALPTAANAVETKRGADYVALVVEAEDGTSRDERWVLTDPGTPTQENDPDPNHTDGASGGEYLELLPDIRVKHGDPFGPPTGFWPQPGTGPKVSYTIDFPEAGRYHVHARVFATGSEDNGIHFGLDGQWPDSAKALQSCTAGERAWRWSSRRRHVGGWPCGVEKSLWLDVESAGTHTVMISAREDGFELDRFMLIKDLSEGTRTCSPVMTEADGIGCRNGGIEVSDDKIDLDLELGFYVATEIEVEDKETGEPESAIEITLEEEPAEPLDVGDTTEIGVRLKNRDIYDDATGVTVGFELAESDWKLLGASGNCERDGNLVSCSLGTVTPTGAKDGKVVFLTLEALAEGLLPVGASVSAEQEDEEAGNDGERMNVEVGSGLAPATLGIDIAARPADTAVAGAGTVTVEVNVENTGDTEAGDVVLMLELAGGLDVNGAPQGCAVETGAGEAIVTCDLGSVAAGSSPRRSIEVAAEESGSYTVEASASGVNADTGPKSVRFEFVAATEEGGVDGAGGSVDPVDGEDGSGTGGEADGGIDTEGKTDGADGADGAGGDGTTDPGSEDSGSGDSGSGDSGSGDSGSGNSGSGDSGSGDSGASDSGAGDSGAESGGANGDAGGETESGSGDGVTAGSPTAEPMQKSSAGLGASAPLMLVVLMIAGAVRRRVG